ncbi:hypothetical protein QBC40DRAFT_282288 [Triangularia verruculosa]|uniref:Uncharacterized protein n=1 Tax=Triangularia verruculosa TaxID=2587418 RepID=A0AAN6XFQ8_9PEZI|nr:hypothetical protein QBC40DRAFT_282288 [Triangularia verruculosa]
MVRLHFLFAAALAHSISVFAGAIPHVAPNTIIDTRDVSSSIDDTILAKPNTVILKPVRFPRPRNTKRELRAAFSLKSEETLYWSGEDGTLAKLRIETAGENESIVNLELIDDLITQVSCPETDGELKLTFAEEADFDEAEDIWQWVNKKPDNHFFLLVGDGACGTNTERIIYNVTGLVYNDEKETAILNVEQTTWKKAAHTFDLTVGRPAIPPSDIEKRQFFKDAWNKIKDGFKKAGEKIKDTADKVIGKVKEKVEGIPAAAVPALGGVNPFDPVFNPDFTIPFATNLTAKTISLSRDQIDASATCVSCFTTGSLLIEARFAAKAFKLSEANVEVSLPDDLAATAIVALKAQGSLLDGAALSQSIPIFEFSPAGIAIPGVLTLGPTVAISLGAELGELKGSLGVTLGGKASLPKGSTAKLDFLSETKMSKSGWEITFEDEPLKVDANVEARASAFLKGSIGVEVSVVETGFAAEITAKAPTLSASMKAITSTTCTACGNFQTGLQGSLSLGASVGVGLTRKTSGADVPLWGMNFGEANTLELAGFCQGFGPQGDQCLAIV